ncbi:MAG TPA: homocysteine S-methyltransferase family protein [Lachnospiraceae bacterium]|nr:homocysteine S-methyltransferase family protein [Lachnospiraceae bacterium]
MNKKEFAEWAGESIIYLDGAIGSNLMIGGMPAGVCPEKWILEHPDVLIKLQSAYVEAGSNIILAPTFTANRVKLSEYGLQDQINEITLELVNLTRKAVGNKAYIAGDITMTGCSLSPIGNMDFEELVEIYKEQIRALLKAGVDMLFIETMMSLQETRAALIAAKESCDIPVLCSLTFEADGRTLYGTDAKTAAIVLSSLGADAVGVNCSTGPADMIDIVKCMAEVVDIPIIAKPNAGLPQVDREGQTCYSIGPVQFANEMILLKEAGASLLGGCCGSNPDYIQKCVNRIGMKRSYLIKKKYSIRYLTSERQTLAFGLHDHFFVIGERINPTGKKKLQESLKEGNMEIVKDFAEEQEACGAKILDINVGMGGIDEKAVMLKVIEEVSTVTNLPLSIDSSNIAVIEEALRRYPGRALVNSVSYEKEKFDKLLPIVKKYGAMFILLPLSDTGLPANIAEKKDVIHKIESRALELGLCKEDIIVDGLVNTVGANKNAALDVLETIQYCKEAGFATTCGLSNISFGLPERSFVNTAFITMAIAKGLSTAIANPSQELLIGCAFASDILLNKENADLEYIQYTDLLKQKKLLQGESGEIKTVPMSQVKIVCSDTNRKDFDSVSQKLYEAVLKGNKSGVVQLTNDALQQGKEPKVLLDQVLMPAIQTVGDFFDKGKYFLPQLIAGAEAMKYAIEVLEPLMRTDNDMNHMPVIIIATVQGDIHDIGKNLVALMLKNYGYRVIDLGKDVSKEKIIEAAIVNNASIIALSALMTTTMKQMETVIEYAKKQGVKAKVIVGGAVLTQDYAESIGADGYSKDAQEAVKLVGKLLEQLKK